MHDPSPFRAGMRRFAALAALALGAARAEAQCPEWSSEFVAYSASGPMSCATTYDDGSGPDLIVVGSFSSIDGLAHGGIARWDGAAWTGLGAGLSGSPEAIAVFDDGVAPPTLYAAGLLRIGTSFANRVMHFDGATWSSIASANSPVHALAVCDFGSGPQLFAAGDFISIGGVAANRIARWTGSGWAALGTGLDGEVHALVADGQGAGARLLVGGRFSNAGGVATGRIAAWNGSAWSAPFGVASTTSGHVEVLGFHDFGIGRELVVGGSFPDLGGTSATGIARRRGAAWFPLGAGVSSSGVAGSVEAIASQDLGSGPRLWVAGRFDAAGGLPADDIATFDGTQWSAAGSGGTFTVRALVAHDDGSGPAVFAGGGTADGSGQSQPVGIVTRIGAAGTTRLTGGNGQAPNGSLRCVEAHDDGSGRAVYVGGSFDHVGTLQAQHVARWSGSSWSALGSGVDGLVHALLSDGPGPGASLYAGGSFHVAGGQAAERVAVWNGAAWSPVGAGLPATVTALEMADTGTGRVPHAAYYSGLGPRVARFDNGVWTELPGMPSSFDGVYELAEYDAGDGKRLYAAGERLYRTTPTGWEVFGQTNSVVFGLEVHDGSLFLAGAFSSVNGVSAISVASFRNGTWTGHSLPGYSAVNDVFAFDDGTGNGARLYGKNQLGAVELLRLDGTSWTSIAASEGLVLEAAVLDDGHPGGSSLYLAGSFNSMGTAPQSYFARYTACDATGRPACFGDGVATNCPCGNSSPPIAQAGCANSTGTGGALRANGLASLAHDTLTLQAHGLPSSTAILFFQGTTFVGGGAGAPFGDGLRCVQGSVVRLGTRFASAGLARIGHEVPTDADLHAAGGLSIPGSRRIYQAWYRNAAAFCTTSTFNLTNALEIDWQ